MTSAGRKLEMELRINGENKQINIDTARATITAGAVETFAENYFKLFDEDGVGIQGDANSGYYFNEAITPDNIVQRAQIVETVVTKII